MRVAMDWRMPTGFLPHALDQDLLLPHPLREGLLSDHLVNSISHTVDALDPRAFFIRHSSGAARNAAFHPRHDGQGARRRLRHGRVLLARDRQQAA